MTDDDMLDEMAEEPEEGATGDDLSDLEPEALAALLMLDEVVRSAELEAAMSPQDGDPEVLLGTSKEEQQDRIEAIGRKSLIGIGQITDYLNPIHEAGEAATPQPLLALSRVMGLTYREVLSQRTRFAKIERMLAAQEVELRNLSVDVGSLTNLLGPKNAKD